MGRIRLSEYLGLVLFGKVADLYSWADPDPATGCWRNIHWYAAKPKGDIQRDEGRMPISADREKFSTFWFTEAEALSKLKLDDEKFSKFLIQTAPLVPVCYICDV